MTFSCHHNIQQKETKLTGMICLSIYVLVMIWKMILSGKWSDADWRSYNDQLMSLILDWYTQCSGQDNQKHQALPKIFYIGRPPARDSGSNCLSRDVFIFYPTRSWEKLDFKASSACFWLFMEWIAVIATPSSPWFLRLLKTTAVEHFSLKRYW